MATTIRQQIVTNIITQLQTITTANGYETNIGSNIFEWKEYANVSTDYPCVIVKDGENILTDITTNSIWDNSLSVELLAIAEGQNTVTDLRKAWGDIIVAINTDKTLGGFVYDLNLIGDNMEVTHDEHKTGSISMIFMCLYRTEAFKPYTLAYS